MDEKIIYIEQIKDALKDLEMWSINNDDNDLEQIISIKNILDDMLDKTRSSIKN
jgi:hypothetical protein